MTEKEIEILKTLKGIKYKVGHLLAYYPMSRDYDTESFVNLFRNVFPRETASLESIRRCRQWVQSTTPGKGLNFCPRTKKVTSYKKPVRVMNLKENKNLSQLELKI